MSLKKSTEFEVGFERYTERVREIEAAWRREKRLAILEVFVMVPALILVFVTLSWLATP